MLKGNNKITTQTGNNPICTYSLNKFLSVMCQYTQPVERDNFALVRPHRQNIVSLKNNVSLGVATKTDFICTLLCEKLFQLKANNYAFKMFNIQFLLGIFTKPVMHVCSKAWVKVH